MTIGDSRRRLADALTFQMCTGCRELYPYPVELHHAEDECATVQRINADRRPHPARPVSLSRNTTKARCANGM